MSDGAQMVKGMGLNAILVEIGDGWVVALASERAKEIRDLKKFDSWVELTHGMKGVASGSEEAPIEWHRTEDRRLGRWLVLHETKGYFWEIWKKNESSHIEEHSSLQRGRNWERDRNEDRCSGSFRVVNHCGRAFLGPKGGEDGRSLPRLDFDIEPAKFDPGEYRILSEALEREVSQILVEWDSPATQWRSAGADSGALLAEKIAFLTTAVGAGKLEDALEQIRRNPHRRLRSETRWSPFGSAMPNLLLRDPLRHGRDWTATCSGHLPQEIEEERKFDSHDTAANRFVKFALGEFLQVCEAVGDADKARQAEGRAPSIAAVEAMRLGAWLRETLDHSFFDDVGDLQRIPFENPTLQSREGYRQILGWWVQLDSVGKIEWEGREEYYQAPDRSLDKLYEYWLYLEIRRMLLAPADEGGMEAEAIELSDMGGAEGLRSLVKKEPRENGEKLRISLMQGKTTLACFRWSPDRPGRGGAGENEWRLHLYYNRRFTTSLDPRRPGSYSSTFIPDFTLMAFPEPEGVALPAITRAEAIKQEEVAELESLVCYWHFDAKYKFNEVFLQSFQERAEEAVDEKTRQEEEKEKAEIKAEGRFKRADLFKMHAYNDAIRRTAGSYVLYPGEVCENCQKGKRCTKCNKPYRKFHEVMPGVGAFVVKPVGDGLERGGREKVRASAELGRFIREALHLRRRPGSNLNNLREAEHSIASGLELIESHGEITALIGWYRTKAIADFCIKKAEIFYWRLKDRADRKERIDPLAKTAQWVIPYTAGKWCGMRLEVDRYEEMGCKELTAFVESISGCPAGLPSGSANAYGVLRLRLPKATDKFNSSELKKLNGVKFGRGGDTEIHLQDFIRKGHRPLCIPYARILQAEQKPAEIPIATQSSDEGFGL
jgi:predicted component of viral defense system (DUF524 family)